MSEIVVTELGLQTSERHDAIGLLVRSHRRTSKLMTPTVVISWLVLVASALYIALLASAIANFT